MKRALVALACAGCFHATTHAMGNVDLGTPMPLERGDPAAYEPPRDPGEHVLGVAPALWFMGGSGRHDVPDGELEIGGSLSLAFSERDTSATRGELAFPFDSWGATVGWGFVQTGGDVTEVGPVSIEATRFWYGTAVSAGAAIYPTAGHLDAGAQVSLEALCYALRLRYLQDSGFEIFGGYELTLPGSITWSR